MRNIYYLLLANYYNKNDYEKENLSDIINKTCKL